LSFRNRDSLPGRSGARREASETEYYLRGESQRHGWVSSQEGAAPLIGKVEEIWGKRVILFPTMRMILIKNPLKANKIRFLMTMIIPFRLAYFLQK